MNSDARRIMAMVVVMVVVTGGVIVLFNNRFGEEKVVSQIDAIDYIVNSVDNQGLNITIRFEITVENYGTVRDMEIPCSKVQQYLKLKNSTKPLVSYEGKIDTSSSYILNSTYTQSTCDNQTTTFRISENVINEVIVAVPFYLIDGTYNFIWEHSFAEVYKAVSITIDTSLGENGISYILENNSSE